MVVPELFTNDDGRVPASAVANGQIRSGFVFGTAGHPDRRPDPAPDDANAPTGE